MKKYIIMDPDTGEIIRDDFMIETLTDKIRKNKFKEINKKEKQFKNIQDEILGNFVFFIFENMTELTKILSDVNLLRYLYIGSYVKSDGHIKKDNNKTYITKNSLERLLKINKRSFNSFYNILINNKLIIEDNDKIKINLSYFYRGYTKDYKKLTQNNLNDNFTRIYIKTIRYIYENTDKRSLGKYSIIYKLLPFVNRKYNLLCNNVKELEKENIEVLTIKDIIHIIGYDPSNLTRFKKNFYSLRFKDKKIFITLQDDEEYKNSIILINPLFYYRGDNIEELQYLINIFKLNKK